MRRAASSSSTSVGRTRDKLSGGLDVEQPNPKVRAPDGSKRCALLQERRGTRGLDVPIELARKRKPPLASDLNILRAPGIVSSEPETPIARGRRRQPGRPVRTG